MNVVGGKLDLDFVEDELGSLDHVRDTAQRLARPTMEDANLTLVSYHQNPQRDDAQNHNAMMM